MLFALYIFGLIITLGPALLGLGLVVIGLLKSIEIQFTILGIAVWTVFICILVPKYNQLKELKKKNELDIQSACLYWLMRITYWVVLVTVGIGLAYKILAC